MISIFIVLVEKLFRNYILTYQLCLLWDFVSVILCFSNTYFIYEKQTYAAYAHIHQFTLGYRKVYKVGDGDMCVKNAMTNG